MQPRDQWAVQKETFLTTWKSESLKIMFQGIIMRSPCKIAIFEIVPFSGTGILFAFAQIAVFPQQKTQQQKHCCQLARCICYKVRRHDKYVLVSYVILIEPFVSWLDPHYCWILLINHKIFWVPPKFLLVISFLLVKSHLLLVNFELLKHIILSCQSPHVSVGQKPSRFVSLTPTILNQCQKCR